MVRITLSTSLPLFWVGSSTKNIQVDEGANLLSKNECLSGQDAAYDSLTVRAVNRDRHVDFYVATSMVNYKCEKSLIHQQDQ